jgi:hypothetical protein
LGGLKKQVLGAQGAPYKKNDESDVHLPLAAALKKKVVTYSIFIFFLIAFFLGAFWAFRVS